MMSVGEPLHAPIILLGTHRSGTTWLGSALARAPGVAYWVEPRPVWVYRNWLRPDDVLVASDATDAIKRHIRRRFAQHVARHGAARFCEKTPSNCLRIPFIREVFPEAKFVLLERDGRAVFRSTQEVQARGSSVQRMWQRVRESSPKDYPAYLSRLPWLWARLTGRPLRFWGVRPPGWRDWLENDSPQVVVAKQWAATINRALDDIQQLPASQFAVVRYEDLVRAPADVFATIQSCVALAEPGPVIEFLKESSDPSRETKWHEELSPELLDEIRPHLEPTLTRLGYAW